MAETKTINFKCPLCGHKWNVTYPSSVNVPTRQRCPECRRYSDDCVEKFNPWAEQMKKQGK